MKMKLVRRRDVRSRSRSATSTAKPVVVLVDGERMEVWPEAEAPVAASVAGARSTRRSPSPSLRHVPVPVWKPRKTDVLPGTENAVIAPIPGVIVRVDVKVGRQGVAYGQVVCLLEAMKMRNPIRVARSQAWSRRVKIQPGQHVHYHEPLIVVTPDA
jgi:biotin carboxyl carrier protein